MGSRCRSTCTPAGLNELNPEMSDERTRAAAPGSRSVAAFATTRLVMVTLAPAVGGSRRIAATGDRHLVERHGDGRPRAASLGCTSLHIANRFNLPIW
jgi:hypothetical protein